MPKRATTKQRPHRRREKPSRQTRPDGSVRDTPDPPFPRMSMVLRSGDPRPLWVEKVFQLPDLTIGNGAGTYGFYIGITPGDFPLMSVAYASLFNQCKLDFAEVTLQPTANMAQISSAVIGNPPVYQPILHTSITALNHTSPSSATAVMNDQFYQRQSGLRPCVRRFKPYYQVDEDAGSFTSDTTLFNRWLSISDSLTVVFGGVRGFIESPTATPDALSNALVFHVYVRVMMGFREMIA